MKVDTVETTVGSYLGTDSTGNATSTTALGGAPDGVACTVGASRISGGGYVRIMPASMVPAITVHVVE